MSDHPRVLVVGAGLAGLVAASHLAGAGAAVEVFERRATVGGRVRTSCRDGFRFDRGFQVLLTGYPAVRRELDIETLGLARFAPGAWLVRTGERSLLGDPLRDPRAAFPSLVNREVTTRDKLRVLNLKRKLASRSPQELLREPDRSIESYLFEKGFSRRFVDRFVAPFYGGITLDRSLSTSSRVFTATFRAFSLGAAAVPARGMGTVADQLAARVSDAGATIVREAEVSAVEPTEEGVSVTVDGEGMTADAAVVATDPPTARELTSIEAIPTTGRGCVTQWYTFAGDELSTGPRLLLNTDDEPGPNHVTPHSAVSPSYAPDGEVLLSATYLGTPSADDETLAERTAEALGRWFPERTFQEFRLLETHRIPFAQFDQPPGIHDSLPDEGAPEGAIYLAGEYTRWSSIQGAMESGRKAAAAVVNEHVS